MKEVKKLTPQVENKYSDITMPEEKDLLTPAPESAEEEKNGKKKKGKKGRKKGDKNGKGKRSSLKDVFKEISPRREKKEDEDKKTEQEKKEENKGKKALKKAWDDALKNESEEDRKKRIEERKNLPNKEKEEDRAEIEANAAIEGNDERIKKAEDELGRELSTDQRKALIKAHNVGRGIRGVFEYIWQDIAKKVNILNEANFTPGEIQKLLRLGLAGDPPPEDSEDNQEQNNENRQEDDRDEQEEADSERQQQIEAELQASGGTGQTPEGQRPHRTETVQQGTGERPDDTQDPELENQFRHINMGGDTIPIPVDVWEQGQEERRREKETQDNDPLEIIRHRVSGLTEADEAEFKALFTPTDTRGRERQGTVWRMFRGVNQSLGGGRYNIQRRAEDFRTRLEDINQEIDSGNFTSAKRRAHEVLGQLKEYRDGGPESRRRTEINNIEQLAQLIIETDPELWADKYPILDDEGNINQTNFLYWIRERILWHHDNESDNSQLNLFALVGVETPYKRINFQTMITDRGKYFRTRDGKDLDELRLASLREVWLFGTSRNADLQYKEQMFSGSELFRVLNQIYYLNTFTKHAMGKSTLRHILTLPEKFRPPLAESSSEGDADKQDVRVGEAIQTAFLAYYNLSDYSELKEILGEDSPLMKRESYENYIIDRELGALKQQMQNEGKDVREAEELQEVRADTNTEYLTRKAERKAELETLIKEQSNTRESKDIQTKWMGATEGGDEYTLDGVFNPDGTPKIIEGDKNPFMEFVNIFTGPEKNTNAIEVIREMIKESIKQRYHTPDELSDTSNTLLQEPFSMSSYAEQWAFSMLRWTGAAARNDTGARSYDKWTELQLTKWKRIRDSSPDRMSGAGNPYSFDQFKALSPDLFNGIVLQDDKTTTPFEYMREADEKRKRGEEYDVDLSRLEFTDNAMRQFAGVHLANTFEILEQITGDEELDFDKFTTYDRYGRLVFNNSEFQSEIKAFFKKFRNAYSTWSQINFAADVRVMVSNKPFPRYETMSLAEAMFGDDVLDHPSFKDENGKFNPENIDDKVLWKQLVKTFIASQVRAHRDIKSTYTHYDFELVESIYDSLLTIPSDIDLGDGSMTDVEISGTAFTKEDMEWIRKKSGTGMFKMYMQAIGTAAAAGSIKGMWGGVKAFVQEATK